MPSTFESIEDHEQNDLTERMPRASDRDDGEALPEPPHGEARRPRGTPPPMRAESGATALRPVPSAPPPIPAKARTRARTIPPPIPVRARTPGLPSRLNATGEITILPTPVESDDDGSDDASVDVDLTPTLPPQLAPMAAGEPAASDVAGIETAALEPSPGRHGLRLWARVAAFAAGIVVVSAGLTAAIIVLHRSATPQRDAPRPPAHAAVGARRVQVVTRPAGAAIIVVDDGVPYVTGRTPLALRVDPARTYDVVVALPGYETQLVHLGPQATELALTLTPPPPARK